MASLIIAFTNNNNHENANVLLNTVSPPELKTQKSFTKEKVLVGSVPSPNNVFFEISLTSLVRDVGCR